MSVIIFDIDGTLTESTKFDAKCYREAVLEHADVTFKSDWGDYTHVTDSGILDEVMTSHGLQKHSAELAPKIKRSFIRNIKAHVSENPVKQISGADDFLSHLKAHKHVHVGIATGGWGETARLKLSSAGIDIEGLPLSSANEALSRVDIMQHTFNLFNARSPKPTVYFGDASWDKKACADLGWQFIAVGSRTIHEHSVLDFNNTRQLEQILEALTG